MAFAKKFTNPKTFRTRTTGSTAAAYGGAVTSKKAIKARGGVMGVRGAIVGGLKRARPFLMRKGAQMFSTAIRSRMAEEDAKSLEAMMKAASDANPVSFDLKSTGAAVAAAIAANPKVQKMAGEAVGKATEYAGKLAEGAARGVFKQVSVEPALGSNSNDIRIASTSVHRMMSGQSVTEKPVGILFFHLGRKQSPYIKKVKGLFASATKFYTYQSYRANYRYYTTGLNSKGSYWGGNSIGDAKIQKALVTTGSNVFQANLNAISAATLPVSQLTGDNFHALNFTTYDDMLALYQTIPDGSTAIVDTLTGAAAGQDVRFPMESRSLEFEITNLNKFLNGHFEIYRLVAKTDILGGGSTPEDLWFIGSSQGTGTAGAMTDTMYLGYFDRTDPGTTNTYEGGIDFNLKATPGLSSVFKQFWNIEEVRKFIVKPDQTVKVAYSETIANGISLDEITRRLITNCAIPTGGVHYMIVARTNPLYVERNATATEAGYNLIAESGFLNYKVANIKKSYKAHVPRRGDTNQPWKNCLGMGGVSSVVLPRYEYASGNQLDSTGSAASGKYVMPVVTPNQVQYGGIKD